MRNVCCESLSVCPTWSSSSVLDNFYQIWGVRGHRSFSYASCPFSRPGMPMCTCWCLAVSPGLLHLASRLHVCWLLLTPAQTCPSAPSLNFRSALLRFPTPGFRFGPRNICFYSCSLCREALSAFLRTSLEAVLFCFRTRVKYPTRSPCLVGRTPELRRGPFLLVAFFTCRGHTLFFCMSRNFFVEN